MGFPPEGCVHVCLPCVGVDVKEQLVDIGFLFTMWFSENSSCHQAW